MRVHRFAFSPLALLSALVFVPVVLQSHPVHQRASHSAAPKALAKGAVHSAGALAVATGSREPVVVVTNSPSGSRHIEAVANASLVAMEQRLGLTLRQKGLTLEVYPTEAAYRRAGGLGNTDACFLGPDRILLKGRSVLPADIAHEFAHVLIGQNTDYRCPEWLEEGIINHENHATPNGQYTPATIADLDATVRTVAASGRDWSLETLSDGAQQSRNMDDAFYGASWSATDYLYRTYGRDKVLSAVRLMSGMSADAAFQKTFGKSLSDVEQDWRATL